MTIPTFMLLPAAAVDALPDAAKDELPEGLDFSAFLSQELPEFAEPELEKSPALEPDREQQNDKPVDAKAPDCPIFIAVLPQLPPRPATPLTEKASDKPIETAADRETEKPFEFRGSEKTPEITGTDHDFVAPAAPEPKKETWSVPASAVSEVVPDRSPQIQHPHGPEAPREVAKTVATLPTPVTHPAWREEFASRVTFLATARIQSAELHVVPPELGPVQLSIRIENNEATVALAAPQAETRQAMESAIPELRELLEAQGIELADASVKEFQPSSPAPLGTDYGGASGSPQQFGREMQEQWARHQARVAAERQDAPLPQDTPRPRKLTLVDVFA